MSRLARAAAAAALGLLCTLQGLVLLRAPAAWYPEEIALRLAPSTRLTLERRLLAVPGAADAPLRFGRDADGAWWLQPLTPAQPVRVERQGL